MGRSGSENRRMTQGVLVRLDDETYAAVVRRAEILGVSKASVIREVIADEMGTALGVEMAVKAKRSSHRKPRPGALEITQLIAEIRRLENNRMQCLDELQTAGELGDLTHHGQKVIEMKLVKMGHLLRRAREAFAGTVRLEEAAQHSKDLRENGGAFNDLMKATHTLRKGGERVPADTYMRLRDMLDDLNTQLAEILDAVIEDDD